MDPEPSAIRDTNVEGPALDIEPSAISAPNVDGSTPDTRTVRDSGPKRGRFNTWIPNRPRYRHQPWMVQHMDVAPSMIQALSVEGPALDIEPSEILAPTVEGSRLDTEPSTIWGISMDG